MGNINLSFKNNKTQNNKKEKVILTLHESVPASSEYYTYIDSDNHTKKFVDSSYIITKVSSSKYIAKKTSVSKIDLNFVPSKEAIEYQSAYFTYNGIKFESEEKPIYDEEKCTYIGKLNIIKTYDKEIKLYEE